MASMPILPRDALDKTLNALHFAPQASRFVLHASRFTPQAFLPAWRRAASRRRGTRRSLRLFSSRCMRAAAHSIQMTRRCRVCALRCTRWTRRRMGSTFARTLSARCCAPRKSCEMRAAGRSMRSTSRPTSPACRQRVQRLPRGVRRHPRDVQRHPRCLRHLPLRLRQDLDAYGRISEACSASPTRWRHQLGSFFSWRVRRKIGNAAKSFSRPACSLDRMTASSFRTRTDTSPTS